MQKLECRIVLAVEVDQDTSPVNIYNGSEACLRAIELCSRYHKRYILKNAELVIRPRFTRPIQTLDTSKINVCIEAGRRAAESNLPAIKKLMKS